MKIEEVNEVLSNWTKLNSYLVGINETNDLASKEKDLKQLLDKEKKSGKRRQFLIRIHGKYTRIRTAREREEILSVVEE